MRKFYWLMLFAAMQFSVVCAQGLPAHFRLWPVPKEMKAIPGVGLAGPLTALRLGMGVSRFPMGDALDRLAERPDAQAGVLLLALDSSGSVPVAAEGYALDVSDGKVAITARTEKGLFYGVQTLKQLLDDAQEHGGGIPACRIRDYPDVVYRAVHIDLKHHLSTTRYYYDLMDRLAAMKINAVIVEFEDKLRYRNIPEVGAAHAISVEEFAAISRYARERHISISPLVQGLGHASFILKHPQYAHLREDPASDWAFSPLDSGTYDLQFALYEEAMAATPFGEFLHVGGDEVGEIGMSTLSRQSGLKPFELQMHWLKRVCTFAAARDRTPVFWDDMVFKLAGLYETTYDDAIPADSVQAIWKEKRSALQANIALFPKNCVYMRWNYGTPKTLGNREALAWYAENDLQVMGATAAQQVAPLMPRDQSNYRAISGFAEIAAEFGIPGMMCTVWDDSSPHFEAVWRGIHHFSGLHWNFVEQPAKAASETFRHRFYGQALADPAFEFQDMLEQSVAFWDTALLASGHRFKYPGEPGEIRLIDLPDPAKPGEWSVLYREKLDEARRTLDRYHVIDHRIKSSLALSTRNRYTLAVLQQINHLHRYPASLLLHMEQFDRSNAAAERHRFRDSIQLCLDGYRHIRESFDRVYEQTRFAANPHGYMLDQNHHQHLANITNNSDWIHIYELQLNRRLKTWLDRQVRVACPGPARFSCPDVGFTLYNDVVPVILDTDIGNDIDDVLALQMLLNYEKQSKVDILGITISKSNPMTVAYLDGYCRFNGMPDVPLGYAYGGVNPEPYSYLPITLDTLVEGKRVLDPERTLTAAIPEAYRLMRQLLAKQRDSSVAMVVVGPLTNLSRLLASEPDAYSPLTGMELVESKVRMLSVMAGRFAGNTDEPEWNVQQDLAASIQLFEKWPTPVVASGWEVGNELLFPHEVLLDRGRIDHNHPLVISYQVYDKMPYDRPSWDLTSVLYAVEPHTGHFDLSESGTISIGADGRSSFSGGIHGKHRYLIIPPGKRKAALRRIADQVIGGRLGLEKETN